MIAGTRGCFNAENSYAFGAAAIRTTSVRRDKYVQSTAGIIRQGRCAMKWMKRVILCGLLAILSVSLLGCNTVRGAGEDIQHGGEAVQRATD